MNFKLNQNSVTKVVGAIAASAFLGVTAILPQSAFAQSSPGASGNPTTDEAGTNNRVDDPSRPASNVNNGSIENNRTNTNNMNNRSDTIAPANSSPARRGERYDRDAAPTGTSQAQPDNRIEKYTQPGSTNPSRSTETTPSTPSSTTETTPSSTNNSQNRGNDRYTAPNSNTPGRGTYTNPSSNQIDNTGVGGGAGGVDNRINNSTSPGSATPGSGSTNYGTDGSNTNTGGNAGGSGSVPGLW